MHPRSAAPLTALAVLLAGCGAQPLAQPDAHVAPPPPPATSIPQLVRTVPMPPPPISRAADTRYSVVVANQSVRDVLLAIARDSNVNFDIHPGIEGMVTINAIDQTLLQILDRITRQVSMRYEVNGQTISVMPDLPYLKSYKVNYVNLTKETTDTNAIATQVISGSASGQGQGNSSSSQSNDNNSTLRVTSVARNRFWETLEANVKDILREADKRVELGASTATAADRFLAQQQQQQQQQQNNPANAPGSAAAGTGTPPEGGAPVRALQAERAAARFYYEPATPVIVSPETGIVTVRATARQHEKVAEFLDQMGISAGRQVMIETTIVEVSLSDQYQSGVDWSALAIDGLGYSITQSFAGSVVSGTSSSPFSLSYSNPNAASGGSLSSTIKLLNQFGTTRVLSSPLLMVLNNQTATLKVVDNRVYFSVKAETVATANVGSTTNFTTTQNVVPIGLIMHITPQISELDDVILSVRPTITSITKFVQDPNPALRGTLTQPAIQNPIPETRTREMQSVLRIASGKTAVLGGLMLDSFEGSREGLPIAGRIPIFGDL